MSRVNTWGHEEGPNTHLRYTGKGERVQWTWAVEGGTRHPQGSEDLDERQHGREGGKTGTLHTEHLYLSLQHWPSSAFCMSTCVRVQRIPPRKDASSTMMKPSRWNWVDTNVNMKRPPEMSRTTMMRRGFWREERDDDEEQKLAIETQKRLQMKTRSSEQRWGLHTLHPLMDLEGKKSCLGFSWK